MLTIRDLFKQPRKICKDQRVTLDLVQLHTNVMSKAAIYRRER